MLRTLLFTKVVVNHEEQYSIWPADRENALDWRPRHRRVLRFNPHAPGNPLNKLPCDDVRGSALGVCAAVTVTTSHSMDGLLLPLFIGKSFLIFSHSYLSAISGSTFVARLAGM